MSGEHSKSKKFLEYISGLPSFSFSLVVLSLVPGWNSLDDHLKRRFDSIQLFLFLFFWSRSSCTEIWMEEIISGL